MLDQMSMPVLFTLIIVVLAILSTAIYLGFRIIGERAKSSDEDHSVAPPAP